MGKSRLETALRNLSSRQHECLSIFTAEVMEGDPFFMVDENIGVLTNYYPSDCLCDWGWQYVDKDRNILRRHPEDLRETFSYAGIYVWCYKTEHDAENDLKIARFVWFREIEPLKNRVFQEFMGTK